MSDTSSLLIVFLLSFSLLSLSPSLSSFLGCRRSGGAPNVSTAALRSAFNAALVQDDAKLAKAMQGFIVQRGVERPLLIKEGRKFCLRIYVVACVRPSTATASSDGENESKPSVAQSSRELEVYVSPLEIARPQKAPFDAASTDPAKNYEDSNPKERWCGTLDGRR